MTSDRRKLKFDVDVDAEKGRRGLKDLGDQADRTEDDFQDLNQGLKKLDGQISNTTKVISGLREEIGRTGDLDLIKDIEKQEKRLKAFTRQRKSLLGPADLIGDGATVGLSVGARLGPFIVQGLASKLGPAAAVGAPLVAGIAAYLGSAAAGLTLGGAAIGAVAGGVALAAQDSRVKTAATHLGRTVMSQLTEAADVFVPATLDAIDIVRDGFRELGPDLQGIFAASARYLAPLTQGVMGLVKEALPGIRRGIEAAAPVIRAISDGLPRVGRAIGDLFGDLADNAGDSAVAVEYLFATIAGGIRAVTGVLEVASRAFAFADKLAAAQSGNLDHLHKYNVAQHEATDGASGLEGALLKLGRADPGIEEMWQRQVLLNKSFTEGIKQAEGFKQALDILNGGALTAREATRAYEESIDALTESIKENGKSLDVGTEKGRANQAALDAVAKAGADRANAIYEQTLATEGQVAAEEAAIRAYEQGRAQLIKSAMQMGLSKQQARALADQIMAIPREWRTQVKADTGAATRGIRSYTQWLARIPRTVRTRLLVEQQRARGGFQEFSKGGPVFGRAKGKDTVPAMLAGGEFVLDAATVDKLGGQSAVEQLRRSLQAGAPTAPAAAGAGGGGGRGGGTTRLHITAAPGAAAMLLRVLSIEVANSYGGSFDRAARAVG